MQKVVNLRLLTQQFVKTTAKRRKCVVNSRLYQSLSPLFFISIMLFSCQRLHAQDEKRISITLKEASIKSALTEVQKLSGVHFSYGQDIDKYTNTRVTYDGKDKSVNETIDYILKSTNLRAVEMDGHYVIEEKPASRSPTTTPKVSAAQASGGLKGRVVEFETSQPLPRASLLIRELKKAAQSDDNGYYQFTDIPAGKYTLQVSYVSYSPENVAVTVNANKEATYDVKLQGSNELDEVIVTAIGNSRTPVAHTSNRQLITEMKSLNVVASGISSQQISMSADRNAAQVMQRIAGVTIVDEKFVVVRGLNERYGATYLNDNVAPSTEIYSRAFALDLIPSRIIDKVLVFKSPSADNQADATGGVVKIYTKEAKRVRHFNIEFQLGHRPGTSFNNKFRTYQGSKTDFLGFDNGIRQLPKAVPQFGDLSHRNLKPSDYVDAFSPVLSYGQKTTLPNLQFTANYYNAFPLLGRHLTMLSSLSYKHEYNQNEVYRQQGMTTENRSISDKVSYDSRSTETAQFNLLQNFAFNLSDSSSIQFKNFLLQQGINTTLIRESHHNVKRYPVMEKENIFLYNQRFLYAGNLGGTHSLSKGRHRINWNGGFVRNTLDMPDQRAIRFDKDQLTFVIGDEDLLYLSRGRYGGSAEGGDPRRVQLGMISRVWSKMAENVYNFSADYTFKINSWSTLKAGTYHAWRERNYDRRVYTVNEGDLKGKFSDYPTRPGGYGEYVDPTLVRFSERALPQLWSTYYFRDDLSGLKVMDRTVGTDSYVGTEQNNSAYLMSMFNLLNGKLDINAGLRYEFNRQKIGGAMARNYTSPVSLNIPILVDVANAHWLPSINLTAKPTENWIIRAGYGETLNRFEFREAAPFMELDYENNQTIQGNPALQNTYARNYDFRIEFYPKGNGADIISAGLFYKELEKPIERILVVDRVSEVFPNITYINAKHANIKGLEIELSKNLGFIPLAFFRNLSLSANLSLIKSEAVRDSSMFISGRGFGSANRITYKRTLQGQAPYILNTGLYYDNAGWGSRLALIYNTIGTRLYAAGMPEKYNDNVKTSSTRGSIFELQRHLLDFSYTQRILKGLQVKLGVQNLLDEPILFAEDYNFSGKYEKMKNEQDTEADNIYSSYKPGRYFTLSLTYSF